MAENPVQWDSLTVNQSRHVAEGDTIPGHSLQINFIYPLDYHDKTVLASVRKQFVLDYFGSEYGDMTPERAAEKYVEDYIRSVRDEERVSDEGMPMEYYEISGNWVLYNRNNLLCVLINKEEYRGGAHGIHNTLNRVIDLNTGRLLKEKDLFVDNYQEDLAKIIVDNIASANNVDNAPELENLGFFNVNEIVPNGNFCVDDTGITYLFNEYEIAAYAVGPVVVQLPYGKVRHLLRADSPLAAIAF
ncbi:MAG: DUF3298 and DUF4163 domain-containing protein [Tannerella sp.]|nr:DUF3298 and DUF4163 domain-containing protein [Tannerella sp.]